MVMPYHLHMPSYFLETFTEYPCFCIEKQNDEAMVRDYFLVTLFLVCRTLLHTLLPHYFVI